jgi:broad specificity phosphatase PhoE
MRRLILIKHAEPEIMPDVPANQWHLSLAGRARCRLLAQDVAPYAPTHIVASTEPKAGETAELIGAALDLPWTSMQGLHEHDRSTAPFLGADEFETTVARFFAEPDRLVFGSETAEEARTRFDTAMAGVLRRYPEGNIAVVAHGTVITLFVAQANPIDAFAFWRRLGLPSMVVLALPELRLLTLRERIGD